MTQKVYDGTIPGAKTNLSQDIRKGGQFIPDVTHKDLVLYTSALADINQAAQEFTTLLTESTQTLIGSLTESTQTLIGILDTINSMLDELRGGGVTYSLTAMTLSDNPTSEQTLTVGDGTITHVFEYLDDLDGYEGENIPVLIDAEVEGTQANTVAAWQNLELPPEECAQIDLQSEGEVLLIRARTPGAAPITCIPPTTVGSKEEITGQSLVNLREVALMVKQIHETVTA
jgi:hypothetical protein